MECGIESKHLRMSVCRHRAPNADAWPRARSAKCAVPDEPIVRDETYTSKAESPCRHPIDARRGAAAVTLVAEIGDFGRFTSPRQLTAWLGLVPKEHSSGRKVARGNITKAGNTRARRVLVEGAWTYRLPARMGEDITRRNEGLPETIRAAAWRAQVRLCTRYRRLQKTGKPQNVIVVAIAREMAAFVWVIARMAQAAVTPA